MGKSSGPTPPSIQQAPAPQPLPVPQFTQEPLPEPVSREPLPESIKRVELPDFKTRQDQLLNKARLDFKTDQAKKKTRQSTVKTSSLLDDEEVKTTGLLS